MAGCLGLCLIMAIWLILMQTQLVRLKRRIHRIIGNSSAENVDEWLMELQQAIAEVESATRQQAQWIHDIRQRLKQIPTRLKVKRYNAFQEQGSDLSFSIAWLNDQEDGVVLTGIRTRDETFIYAKPVEKGTSRYTLTPEEKEVIRSEAKSSSE